MLASFGLNVVWPLGVVLPEGELPLFVPSLPYMFSVTEETDLDGPVLALDVEGPVVALPPVARPPVAVALPPVALEREREKELASDVDAACAVLDDPENELAEPFCDGGTRVCANAGPDRHRAAPSIRAILLVFTSTSEEGGERVMPAPQT